MTKDEVKLIYDDYVNAYRELKQEIKDVNFYARQLDLKTFLSLTDPEVEERIDEMFDNSKTLQVAVLRRDFRRYKKQVYDHVKKLYNEAFDN